LNKRNGTIFFKNPISKMELRDGVVPVAMEIHYRSENLLKA
jgi:hypothetical protein